MVTIGMNYAVIPGKEQIFEDAFDRVLGAMKEMPGHTKSHLYREVGGQGQYLILSDWNDKGAFDAFVKSDSFAKVTNWGKEQILAGRPSHQVYSS